MLVLAIDEGESVGIKLEDGRTVKVFAKIRRPATKTKPGRVAIAIDAPSSIRIDRKKGTNEKEKDQD